MTVLALPQPPAGLLEQVALDAATRQVMVAAAGTPVPLVYGEDEIGGHLLGWGKIDDDLVLCLGWCLGEINSITVKINGAAAPAGVTVTSYLGTSTQGIDSTMQSAVAGWNDTMRATIAGVDLAVAYSVVRIPPGVIDGWPNVTAVIEGLLLYDPRGPSTAYSTNPGLALADFIGSAVYGQGRTVTSASITAAADACDDALSDASKRRTVNLSMMTTAPTAQWIETLRAYAGCYVVPEGDSVKLVPDRPAASVATLTDSDVVAGTMRFARRTRRDAPTVVTVLYTDKTTTPWREASQSAYAAGVTDGSVPWREEIVRLPGIDTGPRAYREAVERLNMAHGTDIEIEWQAFDEAVAYEVGDIVTMTHPIGFTAQTMRILSLEPAEIGRYKIGAMIYAAANYSDDINAPSIGESTLPSAQSIDAPTFGTIASGTAHLVAIPGGAIISRIYVPFTPPVGQYYKEAIVRFKRTTDSIWQTATVDQNNDAAYCSPVEDGVTYDIAIEAVNVFGISSTTGTTTHTVVGKTAPPDPPTSFLITRLADGTRSFTWVPPSPIPIDLAGYELRYSVGTGGSWASMTPLHTEQILASPWETNQLAAGTYTFAIKAIDTTGNESTAVYIEATIGDPRLAGALEVYTPHLDGWPDTKTNAWVDPTSGWLLATDTKTWADLTTDGVTWDTWTSWTRAPNTLTYTSAQIDLGSALTYTPLLSAEYAGTVSLDIRTSDDGVTWSAWAAPSGQVTKRYFQYRATVTPSGTSCALKTMTVILDATVISEDITDLDTSTLTGSYRIGTGDIRLPITKTYGLIRKVDLALQNVGSGWTWEIIDKDTTTGPRVKIYNSAGTPADATIDATIRGVA